MRDRRVKTPPEGSLFPAIEALTGMPKLKFVQFMSAGSDCVVGNPAWREILADVPVANFAGVDTHYTPQVRTTMN